MALVPLPPGWTTYWIEAYRTFLRRGADVEVAARCATLDTARAGREKLRQMAERARQTEVKQ